MGVLGNNRLWVYCFLARATRALMDRDLAAALVGAIDGTRSLDTCAVQPRWAQALETCLFPSKLNEWCSMHSLWEPLHAALCMSVIRLAIACSPPQVCGRQCLKWIVISLCSRLLTGMTG